MAMDWLERYAAGGDPLSKKARSTVNTIKQAGSRLRADVNAGVKPTVDEVKNRAAGLRDAATTRARAGEADMRKTSTRVKAGAKNVRTRVGAAGDVLSDEYKTRAKQVREATAKAARSVRINRMVDAELNRRPPGSPVFDTPERPAAPTAAPDAAPDAQTEADSRTKKNSRMRGLRDKVRGLFPEKRTGDTVKAAAKAVNRGGWMDRGIRAAGRIPLNAAKLGVNTLARNPLAVGLGAAATLGPALIDEFKTQSANNWMPDPNYRGPNAGRTRPVEPAAPAPQAPAPQAPAPQAPAPQAPVPQTPAPQARPTPNAEVGAPESLDRNGDPVAAPAQPNAGLAAPTRRDTGVRGVDPATGYWFNGTEEVPQPNAGLGAKPAAPATTPFEPRQVSTDANGTPIFQDGPTSFSGGLRGTPVNLQDRLSDLNRQYMNVRDENLAREGGFRDAEAFREADRARQITELRQAGVGEQGLAQLIAQGGLRGVAPENQGGSMRDQIALAEYQRKSENDLYDRDYQNRQIELQAGNLGLQRTGSARADEAASLKRLQDVQTMLLSDDAGERGAGSAQARDIILNDPELKNPATRSLLMWAASQGKTGAIDQVLNWLRPAPTAQTPEGLRGFRPERDFLGGGIELKQDGNQVVGRDFAPDIARVLEAFYTAQGIQ